MGRAVFPPSCFTWGQTMVEVMKIMVMKITSFMPLSSLPPPQESLSAPNPEPGHRWPMPLLKIPGHSQASLGQSLVEVTAPFSGSWNTQGFICALQEPVSPVLCKFWQLYGGANGNLLQEGLCPTQVCCTQSPCPCSRPLLTHTSAEDTQTQFWFSLCGVSGSYIFQ